MAVSRFDLLGMDIRIVTYRFHPEYDYVPGRTPPTRSWGAIVGYNTQRRSIDTWGSGGRGDPVGRENGEKAMMTTFRDPNPPYYDWVIWRGRIWTPERGWEVWVSDGTGSHHDHPHETFSPTLSGFFLDSVSGEYFWPDYEAAAEELGDGWDGGEDEFWDERPDDGNRWIKAEGVWIPV